MRAGRLRHRVSIQAPSETLDDFGEADLSWATDSTVWASIEPISGNERFSSDQVTAELTHRVFIRYLTGLTPRKRLLFGSRVFQIQSILNKDEKNEQLELLCREDV
jgi:SPP1 family predicted phage head-tail adaptor